MPGYCYATNDLYRIPFRIDRILTDKQTKCLAQSHLIKGKKNPYLVLAWNRRPDNKMVSIIC